MKKNKKKKVEYIDDGHTIYSMENLVPKGEYDKANKKSGLTGKERWAAIKAAIEVYGPILLLVIGSFSLAMVIIFLWLK